MLIFNSMTFHNMAGLRLEANYVLWCLEGSKSRQEGTAVKLKPARLFLPTKDYLCITSSALISSLIQFSVDAINILLTF